MTEVEQPQTNGIDIAEEDDANKARPADIEADMREMERRKRVEAIMCSRLFREELERIVDSHGREVSSGILQQLSDMVGVPAARVGSVFKSSNCVLPINDIRGIESMGYAKGEKILRCKLAATFRLLDLYGWTQGIGSQITARLNADQELFLVNPFGLLYHEVTASSLNKIDMQGNTIEQGTTNFGINTRHYVLHSAVHAARPDIRCAIYVGCNPVVAVSSLKVGLLPLTNDAAVLGEVSLHTYTGALHEPEEREKLVRSLGPVSKVLLLTNHGALCCGETIEEAFYAAYHIVQACETQLKLLPVGLDNLNLIPEEARKAIYDASRKAPEGFEHKPTQTNDNKEGVRSQAPKWRVGGADFEALMRMLDNAGFRTGYIYRNPLVKSELPKPKNDVEVPPAVSSLGYLLEEEEMYRNGLWKKGDLRKGGDRTRWLNSPNVYQKVEVLETGTPDPRKITKWVADGSPTHSNAVRIEHPLQFVPSGTSTKEFKKLQQLIKDNRRADKISAGPQSHILEGVTWDEANRIKDATISGANDHVVLMGAASKGIIQRGYQHNATVYKAPYAKNPFDSVTDDELNDYKKTVERKRTGDYTDTDYSESEALSSLQISSPPKNIVVNQQSSVEETAPQVHRIETKQAPKPSQPEVVLSDANVEFLSMERVNSGKPPSGKDTIFSNNLMLNNNNYNNVNNNYNIQNVSNQNNMNSNDTTEDDQLINENEEIYEEHNSTTTTTATTNDNNNFNYNYNNFLKLIPPLNCALKNNQCNEDKYSTITDLSFVNSNTSSNILEISDYNNNDDYSSNEDDDIINNYIYNNNNNCDNTSIKRKEITLPYRTLSHFGFNSPIQLNTPNHYHTPKIRSQYIPLKRHESMEDIFSTNKYINCSDDELVRDVLKRKRLFKIRNLNIKKIFLDKYIQNNKNCHHPCRRRRRHRRHHHNQRRNTNKNILKSSSSVSSPLSSLSSDSLSITPDSLFTESPIIKENFYQHQKHIELNKYYLDNLIERLPIFKPILQLNNNLNTINEEGTSVTSSNDNNTSFYSMETNPEPSYYLTVEQLSNMTIDSNYTNALSLSCNDLIKLYDIKLKMIKDTPPTPKDSDANNKNNIIDYNRFYRKLTEFNYSSESPNLNHYNEFKMLNEERIKFQQIENKCKTLINKYFSNNNNNNNITNRKCLNHSDRISRQKIWYDHLQNISINNNGAADDHVDDDDDSDDGVDNDNDNYTENCDYNKENDKNVSNNLIINNSTLNTIELEILKKIEELKLDKDKNSIFSKIKSEIIEHNSSINTTDSTATINSNNIITPIEPETDIPSEKLLLPLNLKQSLISSTPTKQLMTPNNNNNNVTMDICNDFNLSGLNDDDDGDGDATADDNICNNKSIENISSPISKIPIKINKNKSNEIIVLEKPQIRQSSRDSIKSLSSNKTYDLTNNNNNKLDGPTVNINKLRKSYRKSNDNKKSRPELTAKLSTNDITTNNNNNNNACNTIIKPKRNFIMENILNASSSGKKNRKKKLPIINNSNNSSPLLPFTFNAQKSPSQQHEECLLKRNLNYPHNASAIFSLNPFSSINSNNLITFSNQKQQNCDVSTFQQNIINGSPRYWITIEDNTTRKRHRQRNPQRKCIKNQKNVETLNKSSDTLVRGSTKRPSQEESEDEFKKSKFIKLFSSECDTSPDMKNIRDNINNIIDDIEDKNRDNIELNKIINKCNEHLKNLNLSDINNDMEEIIDIQNEIQCENEEHLNAEQIEINKHKKLLNDKLFCCSMKCKDD